MICRSFAATAREAPSVPSGGAIRICAEVI
jgi:hypothetical protein